jgi:hypothetical protein
MTQIGVCRKDILREMNELPVGDSSDSTAEKSSNGIAGTANCSDRDEATLDLDLGDDFSEKEIAIAKLVISAQLGSRSINHNSASQGINAAAHDLRLALQVGFFSYSLQIWLEADKASLSTLNSAPHRSTTERSPEFPILTESCTDLWLES